MKLETLSMNIVNQLYDLAEVSVEKRQATNDEADAFVLRLLQQCSVIGCKELLLQLKNKEMSLVQDKSLEMPERKEHAKNKFALDYVMKMLDELPAL